MIPRYQRILFWSFNAAILLMAAFLLHGCQQAHKRLAAHTDDTPIAATFTTSTEDITLYIANDADGSIAPIQQKLALPQDPTIRARILLDHLLTSYAQPTSTHVLQNGPAVDDVFLLTPTDPDPAVPTSPSGQLAVINLHAAFAGNHPSGIQVENLTILSIIGTLHAAFPQVTQVRFLVDGQPRDTLAGHADLLRTYPAADTTTQAIPLVAPSSTPVNTSDTPQ